MPRATARTPDPGRADLTVSPVTPDKWAQLAAFFGPSGAFGHCWCTWWRQTGAEFTAGVAAKGAGNKKFMHAVVEAGSEPGLLAYRDGQPVGWVSVAPRPDYGRVLRSRSLGPAPEEADDPRVWSVVCFWIPRAERGKGVAVRLLTGAIEHARARGARELEAYPVDTGQERHPSSSVFTGTLTMFLRAGFEEVERRRGSLVIVRRSL